MSFEPPAAVPKPGAVLAGKYRVEDVLGVGGMGVVLSATHLHLDERVAMKLLHEPLVHDKELVGRFLREGKATIKIRSEHVVRVLDVGLLESGAPFMVMELLAGRDLDKLLRDDGPMSIAPALDLVMQALEALAEAHAQGMVHRDLKPANLFLTHRADGSPCLKVLDFGISKVTGAGGADLGMTKTSKGAMGSPLYMAPEQMRSMRSVDARTDIWALGTIIHQLLTTETPFDATTLPELCAAILQDPPPPLRELRPDAPPELEAILLRCMEKNPELRFANVAELAAALAPHGSVAAAASAARIARVLGWVGPPPARRSEGLRIGEPAGPAVIEKTRAFASDPPRPSAPHPPDATVHLGATPSYTQAPVRPSPSSPLAPMMGGHAATGSTAWGQTDPRPTNKNALAVIVGVAAFGLIALVVAGGTYVQRHTQARAHELEAAARSSEPASPIPPSASPSTTVTAGEPTTSANDATAAGAPRTTAPVGAAGRDAGGPQHITTAATAAAPTPSATHGSVTTPHGSPKVGGGLFDDRK